MMLIASITFPYLSTISFGMLSHVVCTCSVGHLVDFTFKEPRLGLNMSSACIMSFLVMLQL